MEDHIVNIGEHTNNIVRLWLNWTEHRTSMRKSLEDIRKLRVQVPSGALPS